MTVIGTRAIPPPLFNGDIAQKFSFVNIDDIINICYKIASFNDYVNKNAP